MKSEQLELLTAIADKYYDGHLTIMKFTTNWRIKFGTPNGRDEIAEMVEGKTFEEVYMKIMLVVVVNQLYKKQNENNLRLVSRQRQNKKTKNI